MIRVYTLPAGSNQVGQWTEIAAAVFTSASADAVELAFTPPPTNESGDELFAFYREISGSGGPVLMQRSTRDLTNWNWSPATSMGQTSREYAGASAAAVYDGRVVAAGAEGLRAFRNTHRGCDGQATTCNDSGYHPGILVDELTCDSLYCVDTPPTCTGGAGELGCACNSTQCDPGLRCAVLGGNTLCVDAAIQTYIQYAPFAEGHNPTEYCDYNDWERTNERALGGALPAHHHSR